MLFDLDDRRKSPNRSGMPMSTNKPSAPGRLVRKQKQLLDVRYVGLLPMQDGRGNDLDLVEFDVSAHKSSTECENEELPLTQLPAASRRTHQQQRQQVLPAMTADRRAATLRANKWLICIFYISQIFILSSNDLSERFMYLFIYFFFFTKLICPWQSA